MDSVPPPLSYRHEPRLRRRCPPFSKAISAPVGLVNSPAHAWDELAYLMD